MDTEVAASRHREYLKNLEGQIANMLVSSSVDYKQIVRELDYECKHSIRTTVDVIQLLYKIKQTGLYDKKKLQRVLSQYAVEYDNILVLKG
jgi:hypothetical protein